ncbi:protein ACCELERATED CELL DEATH 6-like [Prosopis cineraria]|uniref:protein ACCELERATED CELL DEATH 6-like n=1 Tax=Prosopis cineraria TaxID=364024 RepID=UPI00240ECA91|nr:protein ACCELERATED CELL DEATH 6-like [Prosopis cineraria]
MLQKIAGKKWFISSINHVQIGVNDDTMNYQLYNAVHDEHEDVNKFLDMLDRLNMGEQGSQSCLLIIIFLRIVTHVRKDTELHVAAKAIGVMRVISSKFDDASSKDNLMMLPNKSGNRALHEAILSKHREGFDFLLSEQSESTWPLYWDTHQGRSYAGLRSSARSYSSKYREGFDFLLSEQSESTWPFYWDTHPADSPIYVAVQTGDVEILHRLLQIPFPTDWDIFKRQGNSPLFAAISQRNIAALKEIVDNKEKLMFLTDENGDTPLHYAARTGYVEGVRELLNKSTLLAFQRNSGSDLPIHFACYKGHIQVV